MSFNRNRRRLAGLLSALTVVGTGLAGRNLMVSAAIPDDYFSVQTVGSELEDSVKVTEDENYLILSKATRENQNKRTKWKKNIEKSEKLVGGAAEENDTILKRNDLTDLNTGKDSQVFKGKTASALFGELKGAMKAADMPVRFATMLNFKVNDLGVQLKYDEATGEAHLDFVMSPELVPGNVKEKVVYFHLGEKVYATTADILYKAQALSGEIEVFDTDHYALAKECPLAATMLVGMAKNDEDGDEEGKGITEVNWMKYKYTEANSKKLLTGKYEVAPIPLAPDVTTTKYKFGDVEVDESGLKSSDDDGKEKLEFHFGEGDFVLITKTDEKFSLSTSNNNNANLYKSKFEATRSIKKTFSTWQEWKKWMENNKAVLSFFGGMGGGAALGYIFTKLILGGDSDIRLRRNSEENSEDDNSEDYENNGFNSGEYF